MIRFIKSFGYALKGINYFFRYGHNAKIHLVAAIIAITAGIYFQISLMKWCIVIFCIGSVIAAEMLNTSIEKTVDFISPEHHPQAGLIKDLAAGAVLVTSIAALVAGILIFGPEIFLLLK